MNRNDIIQPQLFSKSDLSQDDRIRILLFEYSALRAEVLTRTGYGYQLCAIFVAIATWILKEATANSSHYFWTGVGGLILLFVWAVAINARDLRRAASRVEELEHEINSRAGEHLLIWETLHGVMARMGLVWSFFSRIPSRSKASLPPLDPKYLAAGDVPKKVDK